MFLKIIYFIDEKHFGDKTLVYKGKIKDDNIYFVVMQDRGETAYFFVYDNLNRLYPMNTYINSLGIEITFDNIPECINIDFDIDLSKYGYSSCPQFLYGLIQNYVKDN